MDPRTSSVASGRSADLFPAAKHTSESAEWYTPLEIVEAARSLMRGIDIDPASSARANETVRADIFFDEVSNGFTRSWGTGTRVLLNPPGGYADVKGRRVIRKSGKTPPCSATGACGLDPGHVHEGVASAAKMWWEKLTREYAAGNVSQAVFIGFNSEIVRSTQSCAGHIVLDFPLCFPAARVRYFTMVDGSLVRGDAPPHDSVLAWLPPRRRVRRDPLTESTADRMARLLREHDELLEFEAHFGALGRCR